MRRAVTRTRRAARRQQSCGDHDGRNEPAHLQVLPEPLTLRDQVIAPILAGVRSPRPGRKPAHWTLIDRNYETLRIDMQALFRNLGITPVKPAAA